MNAPARSSTPRGLLIGRPHEMTALQELVWGRQHRLITLVGPAGVGKTRLMAEAAAVFGSSVELPGSVCWVDLLAVDDAALVPNAIASAFGLDVSGIAPLLASDVVARLRSTEALIVLDNFEHVADAAVDVASIVAECPRVTVVTTSRVALHVSGEYRFPVEPLGRNDAAELFVVRARAARPVLKFERSTMQVVGAICDELEGMPLAIELAAARAHVLTVAQIHRRLTKRMELLADGPIDVPARHRSMRAAIEWTYESLAGPAQALLRALAVIPGSFDVELVEAVCCGEPLAVLGLLVDHQLVRRDAERFRIPETVRQFAAAKLRDEELYDVMAHVVRWATAFTIEADRHFEDPDQDVWAAAVEREMGIIRAALSWAVASVPRDALTLANALSRYWVQRGAPWEGIAFLEKILAVTSTASTLERARALSAMGLMLEIAGDASTARARLDEALAMFESCGEWEGVADVQGHLGNVALNTGELADAEALFERVRSVAKTRGDERRQARAVFGLGTVAYYRNEWSEAQRRWESALRYFQRRNDWLRVALTLSNLGALADDRGDQVRALELCRESLAAQLRIGDQIGAALTLTNLGGSLTAVGEYGEARDALDRAIAICDELRLSRCAVATLTAFARLARAEGLREQACADAVRAFDLASEMNLRFAAADVMELASALAFDAGSALTAARALGAADTIRSARALQPDHEPALDVVRSRVVSALGADVFDTEFIAGTDLSVAAQRDLIASLTETHTEVAAKPSSMQDTPALPAGLTKRESEVLVCLVQRLTDREIAATLYISVRTVTTHVARIFVKLGVSGRRDAALEAMRLGLG